jgi:hypothetical protein
MVDFEEKHMACSEPGAIRDEELMAFIEGDYVRPAVRVHLAHCQQCSSRVTLYRRLERKLTSNLYRWDCPSNQVLGDYHLGLLDREQTASVRAHLNVCVLCTAELMTLADFLAVDADPLLARWSARTSLWQNQGVSPAALYPAVAPRTNEHMSTAHLLREDTLGALRKIVATLLLPGQSGLAFQRGVASVSWPRSYVAEGVTVSLQLEPDLRQRGTLQLIGLMTQSEANVAALAGISAQLLTKDSVVQVQRIDELGNVIFTALPPATYVLELLFPERTIVVEQIPVTQLD